MTYHNNIRHIKFVRSLVYSYQVRTIMCGDTFFSTFFFLTCGGIPVPGYIIPTSHILIYARTCDYFFQIDSPFLPTAYE